MKIDKNEKIKLGCAVLCEGKYDKIKLSSVIDGVILTTDGFSVFNNTEKRALLKKMCLSRGLVIITDSDKAGFFIRSKLKGMLPPEKVKHLYIPQIKGREKRKKHDSKDGLLGVEGIDADSLREIILRAKLDEGFENDGKCALRITKAQLFALGLSGGENSAVKREKLCEKFDLPKSLTTNALAEALFMLGISYDDVAAATEDDCDNRKRNDFFPKEALEILQAIKAANHECYLVGGCVRDYLMGISAHDFDLTTDAVSEEIIEILQNRGFDAFLMGGDCGTVGAKKDSGETFEITPYRAEGEYRDHRHPEKVTFVKDLKCDLARRDFTVNSMALTIDEKGNETIVDIFGGRQDMNLRLIRCVGNPTDRFEEDALRILRAFRFSTRFGFEIEGETAKAIKEKSHLLAFISGERKQDELKKILENGCIEAVLRQFPETFSEIVGNFVGNGVDSVKGGFCEKLFFMLSNNDKTSIKKVTADLKLSKADREKILEYKDISEESQTLLTYDIVASHGYLYKEYLTAFGDENNALEIFSDSTLPKLLSELDISGDDLKELGISGKDIGKELKRLLSDAIAGKVQNNKNSLMAYIKMNKI